MRSIDLGNPFAPDLDGACELLLVRHGEQNFTADMTIGDGVDTPLSELGEAQAIAVGERMSTMDLDAVYSSPLQRAHNTGLAIAGHHDLEVHVRPDLHEINMFAGLPQDLGLVEAMGGKEATLAMYKEANLTNRWDAYPDCEPVEPFRQRVVAAIDAIAADHVGQRVVVACHGGIINTYLSNVFRSDHDRVVSIHHTSITTVRTMGDMRAVLSVNDFAHVLPLQSEMNPFNAS